MKVLVVLMAVALSAVSAQASTLTALSCLGANGVSISTTKELRSGLQVKSTWGLSTRNFVAKLGLTQYKDRSYIELYTGDEVEFLISLKVNPESRRSQLSSGQILAATYAGVPVVVTTAKCRVQFSDK